MIAHYGNSLADEFLNIPEINFFFIITERNGLTGGSGPAGSSDPVYISFRNIRQIKIDDQTKLVNVDPACSNIGCDEDLQFSILESLQGSFPGLLCLITMQGCRLKTGTVQVPGHAVSAMLGSCKNKHTFSSAFF